MNEAHIDVEKHESPVTSDIRSTWQGLVYGMSGSAPFREGNEADTRPKARILIVEDEGIVALDIESCLENLDYAVAAVVPSGEEAIEKAAELRPDLVLMDIRLRGKIDGVQAAKEIRARFDIPVIYLTAHADHTTLERAKLTEPFGYLLKPFEENELHTAVEMALYKHEMEKRLRESEQWLATTLQSIGDAVIATDAQACVTFMNPVAEALTGWSQDEAFGRGFEEVFHAIHQQTRSRIESPIARVLQEGVVVGLGEGVLLIARDGTEISVDDSAAPIRNDRGKITGAVLVFRDVSEQVEAERALREYAADLKARNEELDAFAHTVAHDLKAPLNPLIGFAQVLENDFATLPEENVREYLNLIARSGLKMNAIIEELMLLAQLRKREVEIRTLSMEDIVAEAQERLAYMIQEHQAQISLPDNWPSVQGYGPWVEEVWANYLSNGIKYGGQPPHLKLEATPTSNGAVRFWVIDNGPGLTAEEQARLFTPFTQLSQVRAKGHGLGLSIVRRIVERLGGQAGVVSEVGHGSAFFFTLPRATE